MQENKLYVSKTKIFERNNTIALLDINSGRVFKIDKPTKQIINYIKKNGTFENGNDDLTNEIVEELKSVKIISNHKFETNFVLPENDDDIKVIRFLDLLVSQDCNMACAYCFAEEGVYNGNRGLMSWDIARRSIDFLVENSGKSKELHVTFFGGEPLLNIPIIKKVIDYSKQKTTDTDKVITFGVSTNGTLLEPDIVSYFEKNKVNVQISIDGGADSQNSNRPLSGNLPSYDRVVDKVKNLLLEKRKIQARATVTKNNIESIKEDAEHLLGLGFNSVHIEHAAGIWNDDLLVNSNDDFKKMTDKMMDLYEIFENILDDGELLKINNFIKMIKTIHKRSRRFYGCGAGRGYLCIDINGDISTCHRLTGNEKHDLGNINKNNLSIKKLKEIKEKSYLLNKSKCNKCWAKFICGGDCIAIAEEVNSDIGNPDSNKCAYNKKLIERSILVYASLSKSNKEKLFKKTTA